MRQFRLKWLWWRVKQMLSATLSAPLRWYDQRVERRREHELALARVNSEAFAQALTTINAQNAQLMTEVVKSSQEASKVLQQWLDGFKVVEMPKHPSTAMTDELEALLERERKQDQQLGVEALPQDTITSLAMGMGQDPPTSPYRPIGGTSTYTPLPANLSNLLN